MMMSLDYQPSINVDDDYFDHQSYMFDDDLDNDFAFLWLNNEQNGSFKSALSLAMRRRRDRRIPRIALHDPRESAWVKLYSSNSEQALITFTGLDYPSYNYLSSKFEVLYQRYTPYSANGKIVVRRTENGRPRIRRPRLLDSRGCLALVCAFTRTRGSMYCLQLLFGITASPLSLFLRFGRRLLLRILKQEPGARVQMPSIEEINDYKEIVLRRYPNLNDVWFVMDGLKLYIEQGCGYDIQACFYNGWMHDHYVSNVFVFAPSGLIVCCSINAPG
jgi:hypothetical protein